MSTIQLALAIAALILGIIGVIGGDGRNWAAWGVIALSCLYLVGRFG